MGGAMATGLVVWYVVFLFSVTFHEAMHAFVSHRFGDSTAYQGGQVTLNPLPHIQRSPIGMVALPLLSFFMNGGSWMIGWASAPFNPMWAARYPRRSFLMSLAGPGANLILTLAAFIGLFVGLKTGFFGWPTYELNMEVVGPGEGNLSWALALMANVVFRLNLVLLVFNLLPVPPMDGSEIWYLFVKKEEDRLRYRYQAASYSLAGLMVAWWLFPKVYIPVYFFVVQLLYSLAL